MKVTYGAIVQRASGKFGGTVHSNWKGVDVVRRFAKPSNPNTAGQVLVRDAFRTLNNGYVTMPANTKAAWTSFATGKQFIARNSFIGKNVSNVANNIDMTFLDPTPGDSSTLPPISTSITFGAGQIDIATTVPAAPTGWTLVEVVGVCYTNTDPTGGLNPSDWKWAEAIDLTNPYAPSITGLNTGPYVAKAFIKWTAPDGTTRYSAARGGDGVVT